MKTLHASNKAGSVNVGNINFNKIILGQQPSAERNYNDENE